MSQSIFSDNKKVRGRPKTGVGKLIGLRWHEADLALIDRWRKLQPELPSQAEAIRRLVELGLAAAPSNPGKKPAAGDQKLFRHMSDQPDQVALRELKQAKSTRRASAASKLTSEDIAARAGRAAQAEHVARERHLKGGKEAGGGKTSRQRRATKPPSPKSR